MSVGLHMTFRMRDFFFDRERVRNAVDAGTRKALSKTGAYIMTTVRRSMRRRKKVSQPGQPPSAHQGDLRRFLYFAYEPVFRSVVIGPVLLNKNTDAPAVLERGGTTAIHRRLPGGRIESKTVRIAARPYMFPAYEQERPRIPQRWRGVVSTG